MALILCGVSLAVGFYIEYKLRPYRIFHLFTGTQRGWRDQAFEVAFYAILVAAGLFILSRILRRI